MCFFFSSSPEIPTTFVCCLQQRTPSQSSMAYGKHAIALAEAGGFSYAAARKAWVDADQSNRAALRDLIFKRETLEGLLGAAKTKQNKVAQDVAQLQAKHDSETALVKQALIQKDLGPKKASLKEENRRVKAIARKLEGLNCSSDRKAANEIAQSLSSALHVSPALVDVVLDTTPGRQHMEVIKKILEMDIRQMYDLEQLLKKRVRVERDLSGDDRCKELEDIDAQVTNILTGRTKRKFTILENFPPCAEKSLLRIFQHFKVYRRPT